MKNEPPAADQGGRPRRRKSADRDLVDGLMDAWRSEFPELGQVEFSLARRAVRLGAMLEDALLECLVPWGLTRADFSVLNTLRSTGTPFELRPSDLKARLLMSSGGVTNVLNRLEKPGLIERVPDKADGRSSWVRLTQDGVDTAEAATLAWSDFQRDFFRAVDPELAGRADDALREVLLALGDREPPAAPRRSRPA